MPREFLLCVTCQELIARIPAHSKPLHALDLVFLFEFSFMFQISTSFSLFSVFLNPFRHDIIGATKSCEADQAGRGLRVGSTATSSHHGQNRALPPGPGLCETQAPTCIVNRSDGVHGFMRINLFKHNFVRFFGIQTELVPSTAVF